MSTRTAGTSYTVAGLGWETTHTFVVEAMDFANHVSSPSDPIAVTTEPRDTSDTTPPNPPATVP